VRNVSKIDVFEIAKKFDDDTIEDYRKEIEDYVESKGGSLNGNDLMGLM